MHQAQFHLLALQGQGGQLMTGRGRTYGRFETLFGCFPVGLRDGQSKPLDISFVDGHKFLHVVFNGDVSRGFPVQDPGYIGRRAVTRRTPADTDPGQHAVFDEIIVVDHDGNMVFPAHLDHGIEGLHHRVVARDPQNVYLPLTDGRHGLVHFVGVDHGVFYEGQALFGHLFFGHFDHFPGIGFG